jgi:hypothetical protein
MVKALRSTPIILALALVSVGCAPALQGSSAAITKGAVPVAIDTAMLESMRTLGPSLAQSIREDLGPALRASLRDEVGPGIASVFDAPELQKALGRTAQTVAHEAILGSNAALAELAEQKKHDQGGQPLGTVAQLFAGRSYLLIGLALLLLVVLPFAWMGWQLATVRRYLEQVSGKSPRELRRSLREAR